MGMVGPSCNPSTWELRQEDLEFQASIGCTVRQCLTKIQQVQLMNACCVTSKF